MAARKRAPTGATRTRKTIAREELFVASFLSHGNSAQAARDAGYSAATSYAKGNELLKRPTVIAAIERSRTKIVRKFKVTSERVVEEMALIGFSSIDHYRLDNSGHLALAEGAPPSAIRAVRKFKRKLRVIPQKPSDENPTPEPILEVESEFELWSKDTELRALGDYLAMFKENRDLGDKEDENLTLEQRRDRVIALLRTASKRRKEGKKVR